MSIKLRKIFTLQENFPSESTEEYAWTPTPTTSQQSLIQTFHFSKPLCLVNLNLLAKALWCNECDLPLSLRSCIEEQSWLDSTCLKVNCPQCDDIKVILLCNEDPDDDAYHNPFSSNDVSDSQTLCASKIVPAPTSHGNLTKSSEKSKKAKIAKTVTKGKRGRPPGSKNKNIVKPTKQLKTEESPVKDDCSLPKQTTIPSSAEPPDECTSASLEAAFSDGGNESVDDIKLNLPAEDEAAFSPYSENGSSDGNVELCDDDSMKNKQCLYCPRIFFNNNLHAQHMKNEHPEVRAFFCEICSDEFTTIYFLRKHKMEAHLPKNSPKCETCGQGFPSIEMLQAHKLKHLPKNARQFKCSQCSKKFFEAKRLRVHMLRFHLRKEGAFKCAHCPRSYDTKRKLLRHILEHVQDDIYAIKHGNEYARWKCEYCDKIFKNMGRQLVHMRECHPEFKAMICGWCGEQCSTVKSFQKHRRLNHRTDSLYVCDECGKPSLNPKKLALHKLSHRTDNEGKEFLCSYCPRAFAENSALADHIKRFHIITTYYCEHCPKTFKMKFNIRRHMQLHTGVFRHSCQYCGANFVAADGRDHHIRNCHRFMCVICSSIFPTKDEVVMHRIGEHPSAGRARDGDPIFEKITDFNCEICFRYLSSKQALNTHLRTHMKRKSKEVGYNGSE